MNSIIDNFYIVNFTTSLAVISKAEARCQTFRNEKMRHNPMKPDPRSSGLLSNVTSVSLIEHNK